MARRWLTAALLAAALSACGKKDTPVASRDGTPTSEPKAAPAVSTPKAASAAKGIALDDSGAVLTGDKDEIARRTKNIAAIARAVINYASSSADGGQLPEEPRKTEDGPSLLSWRVLIVDYLPGSAVKTKDFKLDEPWDSEHNKKLIEKMPDAFKVVDRDAPPGHTYYRGFIAPKGADPGVMPLFSESAVRTFSNRRAANLNRCPDGAVNTLMVVEAADAVPWTKPAELPYDGKSPLPKLGNPATGYALVSMLSADPRILNTKKIDEEEMRGIIAIADGRVPRSRGLTEEAPGAPPSTPTAAPTSEPKVAPPTKAVALDDSGPILTGDKDEIARRTKNIAAIARAMHNHAAASPDGGQLPYVILATTPDKHPLLSWRVLIVDYLPGSAVKTKDFKLDEPWDSEHNKKLLDKMPDAFKVAGRDAPPGHTYYRGFAGTPDTDPTAMPVFSVKPRTGPGMPPWVTPSMSTTAALTRWPDGTMNTLMVVEAADAVPWTKPEELPYDGKLPLPKLGNPATGHALAVMASAEPRILNTKKLDERELRAAITVADGKRPTVPGFGYTPPPSVAPPIAPPPPPRPTSK